MKKPVLLSQSFPALLFSCLLGIPLTSLADEKNSTENIIYKGFVSQSFIKSWENPYLTEKSLDGSFDMRELSLNVNWLATDNFRMNGQVLSQKLGQYEDGKPKVDFLLAEYNYPQADSNKGIRIGRVKTPYGLFNRVRDIPTSRPGFTVPNSVYLEGLRDFMISTDGVNLYGEWFTKSGEIEFDAYAGKRESSVIDGLVTEEMDDLKFDHIRKQGARLFFRPANVSGLQVGASGLRASTSVKGAISSQGVYNDPNFGPIPYTALSNLNVDVVADLYLLSVEYKWAEFIFRSEYERGELAFKGDSRTTTTLNPSFTQTSPVNESLDIHGYYVQLGWELSPKWTWYVTHENYRVGDGNTKDSKQTSNSLAFRWNMTEDWSLSSQYSDNNGIGLLPYFNGMSRASAKENWGFWGTTLTYLF